MNNAHATMIAIVCLAATGTLVAQQPQPPGQGSPFGVPGLPGQGARVPGVPGPSDDPQPETGTAGLDGRVTDAGTGRPLRRATVTLRSTTPRGPVRTAATGDDGRYAFGELPAGRYTLTATRGGYATLDYAQRQPFAGGRPLTLADGATEVDVDFALPRGGVIVVRVTDDFNEPVAGAMVQVHRFQYGPDGRRTLAAVSTGGLRSMTDDRGEVRAFGLAAGEYVVGAQMSIAVAPGATSGSGDERAEGFVATYYPGTVSVEESVEVAVGPAQETFAQFALVPSRLSRVSGTVVDSSGRPASGAAMTLVTRMGNGASSRAIGTVSATGAFSVDGIPPGEHTLNVLAGSGGERASLPVVVGSEDLTGLRIVTTAGATVRGRIVFEGTTPPATDVVQSPRVRLTPVDGAAPPSGFPLSIMLSSTSQADRTGAFELTGATGRLLFDVTTPPGWEMTSVRYEGRDITDVPLDLAGVSTVSDVVITLTSDLTSVAGSASDGQGRRVSDYVVVVQPSQTLEPVIAARRVRALRPDAQGRFETQGLRPGRYVATALESLEDGRQFDPAFREELRRRGETFDLRDGGTVALDLTVASGL